ncbi:hypothetical protein [Bacillus sp. TE8-1]|uniref:hypothetical protein n=1 Tax=Bacillus sp. TE8-1 TaxID=2217829 RepID=UPI0011EBBCD4|nr:hypothetical protein [Bacillus sp. TE8-1]KAA0780927.1 hypothetical protein DN404_00380 [Bacillus sp. TE8-1]HDR7429959.1 hypothetical protein [Bacillus toyonensis]
MNRFKDLNRGAQTSKEIPFDHIVKFKLCGEAGNRIQRVINISSEGPFIATHMSFGLILKGYGTIEKDIDQTRLAAGESNPIKEYQWMGEVQRIKSLREAAEDFLFYYSLVDSATGRELQSDKLLQLATIGRGDGVRPFRELPQHMLFQQCSTVRVEVEEIIQASIYKEAELCFVLQGYKILI